MENRRFIVSSRGGGVYLGPENRRTAQNFRKNRKTARKIGKTEKPKIQSFLLLQLILIEMMVEKINKTEKPMKNRKLKNRTGFQLTFKPKSGVGYHPKAKAEK